MDLAEYRTASLETWDRMAAGWHQHRNEVWSATRQIGEWLVEHADPRPSDTVLELACGAGDTGFAAAARSAHLISTDFSPAMVAAAQRRAAELGIDNAEFRVMDAERMDLEDDSVDCAICRFGYMLMADPAAALAETRRVLRDGGRLALAVWGAPEANLWAALPARQLVERGHMPPPEPGAPSIFALADEERLRGLVAGAGFEVAALEPVDMTWRFDDFDSSWAFLTDLAGALAMVVEELPEDEHAALREAVQRDLEPLRVNGGYVEPGQAVCVQAS
jgi:SAM-dependent methyltransferase